MKQMNVVTIKPFKEDSHKYHGHYENIGYVRPLDKTRLTADYKKRARKIWSSTTTFGISCWTIREIQNLNITTRKVLDTTI